eukprot:TRINITY_DN5485_c0_g2_i1.p1 TRINITY_DN5485_c0_g2~~TRINITY_DN5485_c0_g2_i1.p1  ORF type:complete len:239 (+),score=45.48 TRINITY_DN5485_c0_g2_i1:115-831(+)
MALSKYLTDDRLIRVQAYSGFAVGAFTALHVANHVIGAVAGVRAHTNVMETLRTVYQSSVFEAMLGVAFGVHISAGLLRWFRRVKRQQRFHKSWPLTLHRYSGYTLALLVPGHVFATRIVPFRFNPLHGADITYTTLSMKVIPFYFHVYYVILLGGTVYHATYGAITAWRALGVKLSAPDADKKRWGAKTVGMLAGAAVVAAALGGMIYPIDIPRKIEYLTMYRSYWPRFLAERYLMG